MTPKDAKIYKPRRPGTTLADVVTPEERERRARMRQEVEDVKMQPKLEEAYTGSMTSTEAAPEKKAGGGVTRADGCITKGHTRGTMVRMAGA